MKSTHIHYRRGLLFVAILTACVFILISLWTVVSTTEMGGGDFWGYWSSAFLLHNGQNPYDPEAMALVQVTQMQTGRDFTIMSWNPPTLFIVILPFSYLPITIARYIWVITNLTLTTGMILLLTKLYLPHNNALLNLGFLLFSFAMPQILTSIYAGQVTMLVSFGLVACMALINRKQWFWAGAILILTTIKPHLVVLQVMYILVYMAYKRKFQGWAGILITGITFLVVAFIFRPQLINDLIGLSKIAPTQWLTPTVGGWLSFMGITELGRYLILLFLPIPFILAKQYEKFSVEFSVAMLTLLTVPFTFFGWGYDQAILLIPIVQVFQWLYKLRTRPSTPLILFLIVLGVCIHYYQKITVINEVYYLWIPLFWGLIFALTLHNFTRAQIQS